MKRTHFSKAGIIIVLSGFGAALAGQSPRLQSKNLFPPPNSPLAAGSEEVTAEIDASQTRPPISKYMYGQFIEHLGDLINRGLWAEMIDDRKFFYEINSKPDATSPTVFRRRLNHWRPIGPDESVVMDREHPYVGEHAPLIKLSGDGARGIKQSGLALRKVKGYVGRVVLAGAPTAKVTVSLVWGPNAADRQTLTIPSLRPTYSKFPLRFSPRADTDDGRIEITGTGRGSFHVGAVSLMPADNIHGFRADTVGLLQQLHSGIYRFPGGNYVSNFEWTDSIGDEDKRPPRWDNAWHWVQPNDVGLDEFMVLCGLLGVEPYITVNAGFGDARSAADMVEYANGPGTTPMGKLRAANSHPAPYHIKWWGIGNEMYGVWQFGQMQLSQYVIKHNMFADAMRRVDPTIKLIASGASPDEMTVTGSSLRLSGKLIPDFGGPGDWDGGLLLHCLDNLDVISEHFYTYDGQHFDLAQGKRVDVKEPLIEWARKPANRVRTKVEAYQDYAERIPALKQKPVPMNIDEWAYSRVRPNLKNALSLAWAFQEMFRHTDVITMAAHTMGTSCLDIDPTESAINTVGMMFRLYRDHFGTIPVVVSGNSPQPAPMYPVGGDQPKVNAGSDTYPLDVAAAWSSDRKYLTVAVVNPTESAHELDLSFKGVDLGGGKMWQMTGPNPDAATGLGHSDVKLVETSASEVPRTLSEAPMSISIYEFEKE